MRSISNSSIAPQVVRLAIARSTSASQRRIVSRSHGWMCGPVRLYRVAAGTECGRPPAGGASRWLRSTLHKRRGGRRMEPATVRGRSPRRAPVAPPAVRPVVLLTTVLGVTQLGLPRPNYTLVSRLSRGYRPTHSAQRWTHVGKTEVHM